MGSKSFSQWCADNGITYPDQWKHMRRRKDHPRITWINQRFGVIRDEDGDEWLDSRRADPPREKKSPFGDASHKSHRNEGSG
jgi:hypothetical protein